MKHSEIFHKLLSTRDNLKQTADFEENRIDDSLELAEPFCGKDEIKLIILGQDSTIKKQKTRPLIKLTLNLDTEGSLKKYLSTICSGLEISFENIYATNVFKYFYTKHPGQTINVLQAHLEPNLELFKNKLAAFPNAKIITLGEPVLQLLAGKDKRVKDFWDYNKKTGKSNGNYSFYQAKENKLERDFYPFPHQPSIRKERSFIKNPYPDILIF